MAEAAVAIHMELVTTVTAAAWVQEWEIETAEAQAAEAELVAIGNVVQQAEAAEQAAQAGWQ
jgi:aerobic-type carbon monoxide dehydrogenase small subunit (CoxS/CutS family)